MATHTVDAREKLRGLLREVIRQSAPARPLSTKDTDPRLHVRYGRVLPALVVPVINGEPALEQATFCISKDLSDQGISLIHDQFLRCKKIVVGLWSPPNASAGHEGGEPIFVMGKKRARISIGGGFWQTGVALKTLYADPKYLASLRGLAKELVPPSGTSVAETETR